MKSKEIVNQFLSTLKKEDNKEIKDSKHSPVYRKRGVEGFAPLFSFFFVNLGKAQTNMKLYIKILVVFWGVFLITKKSEAQGIKPFIDFALIDPDNPLVAFDTAAIFVHVKIHDCATNTDTGGFFGNLKYWMQTDKMGQHEPFEIDPFEIDNDPLLEYMPFGGKVDTLYFLVDTALFKTTGVNPVNVIIIWPAFINISRPMCDSGQHVFWNAYGFPGILGMNEETPQGYGSTVFPNPAASMQLVFINSKYSQDIARVSIVNMMGQVMNTKEFYEGADSQGYVLPTEELRSGIYNIHITYKDKKNEVVKFIKN